MKKDFTKSAESFAVAAYGASASHDHLEYTCVTKVYTTKNTRKYQVEERAQV